MRERLAPGAPASAGAIPLAVPVIQGNEWKYIKECLDTNWVSSVGPFVDRFEQMVAELVGARYAVATINGTAALHVALLVAGVMPDDEVIVPTLTFIAPANAVRYVGAWPVFIDAEPDFWQIDPQLVANFMEKECQWRDGAYYNRITRRRVKAILPVHLLGHPCDMAPLQEIANKYELPIIEDATESLGAAYNGQNVGHLGNIACFSFNGNKVITTGGGGMIVTDNESWALKAKYLTTQAKDDPIEYIHHTVGFNYRLTNIQAAMGCAQLEQLNGFIAAKRRIAGNYARAFSATPGITPMHEAPWAQSIFWMFTVLVNEERCGIDSRTLLRCLGDAGIQARPLWQPLHLSKAHQGAYVYDRHVADQLHSQALSLPCSPSLTPLEQTRVIAELLRHVDRASSPIAEGNEI